MKTNIKNRKSQNVVVLVDHPEGAPRGLAFVMHGLGGSKMELHIQAVAEVFVAHGYTTVRFDTTNSQGESEGDYGDATITGYYEDLEDVIAWARTQSWFQQPFILSGHSLGGICSALFAERHPEQVKALAPISTVVSGALSFEATGQEAIARWQSLGYRERVSGSTGRTLRLKWAHMEDRLKYDLLPEASQLTMPVLLVVGEKDEVTPPKHQHVLHDALPGPKELHAIAGAHHPFVEARHLSELKSCFDKWLTREVDQ